jgi:DNA-directed RNA polymerase
MTVICYSLVTIRSSSSSTLLFLQLNVLTCETQTEQLMNNNNTTSLNETTDFDISVSAAIAAQFLREETYRKNGVERYREQVRKAEESGRAASTIPAVKLHKALIAPATEAVERWIADTAKTNRTAHRARVVSALGAEHTAFLVLQFILNNLGERSTAVAARLGQDIEDNVNLGLAMKDERTAGLMHYLLKDKYKGGGKYETAYGMDKARRKQLGLAQRKDAKKKGDQAIVEDGQLVNCGLTAEERMAIGTDLLDCVVSASSEYKLNEADEGGIFALVLETEFNERLHQYQSVRRIRPTAAYNRYMSEFHGTLETLRPAFEPMLCKPSTWTTPFNGGYLTHRLPVIKGLRKDALMALHEQNVLQPLYDAVNTLQATRWKINEFVLETAVALWNDGAALKCWPEGDKEVPAKPAGAEGREDEFKVEQPEAWRKWKAAAAEAHKHNESVQRATEIAALQARLEYAATHVNDGNATFHEVWQADFRARLYPVSSVMHSQGDDLAKALFRFAEGKPLDEDAAFWLAIHVANAWANEGVTADKTDKAPIADRLSWVYTNSDRIVQAGTDPLADLWWTQADGGGKPWQFLAACQAWAGWKLEGVGYCPLVPVSVDGSNNGLQHYSALLRSKTDGQLVNLVPTDKPEDIYRLVAERANAIISTYTGVDGDTAADIALKVAYAGKVTRSVAKRPTMTYSYSVTYAGILGQLLSDSKQLFVGLDKQQTKKAASFLASTIFEAIKDTVSSAAQGMDFLKAIAELVASQGEKIVVDLPDGVRIVQNYTKFAMKSLTTTVSGSMRVKKDKVSLVQQSMRTLSGLTLDSTLAKAHEGLKAKDARKLTKDAKEFIAESGLLQMYRSEVEKLLQDYAPDYDFDDLLFQRYKAIGLKPVAHLEQAVKDAFVLVIKQAIATYHMREEEVEETDEESGEVKKKVVRFSITEPTDEVDVNASKRGIAPNIIHALDATHLRMTLKAALAEGLTEFQMVHDSYGTHAADMTKLARILREQFVELHRKPFLEVLGEQQVARGLVTQEQYEELKAKYLQYGDLDLDEVLNSKYFFL